MNKQSIPTGKIIINWILVTIAVLVGGFFRFYNLNWDDGHYFHSDERNIAGAVTKIRFFTQLNPGFFSYGSLPVYLYRAGAEGMVRLTSDQSWTADWAKITTVGRFFSAVFSVATLFLIYILAKLVASPLAALLALCFTAFMPLLIQQAHFAITESMITFWGVLLTLTCVRSTTKNRFFPVITGIILGLACATKASAISLVIIPLATLIFSVRHRPTNNRMSQVAGNFIFFFISFFFVYIVISPYTFLDWQEFTKAMRFESRVVWGKDVWVYVYQFLNTTPYIYQLKQFWFTQGFFLSILSPLGMLYVIFKTIKQNQRILMLVFLWPIIYFLYVGSWFAKFVRYLAPIYPFFALAAAILINDVYWRVAGVGGPPRRGPLVGIIGGKRLTGPAAFRINYLFSAPLLSIVLALPFLQSLAFFHIYTTEQTRITASKWIFDTIPAGSKILTEHWDEGLPIPLKGYPPLETYISKQLEIYQPDDNKKLQYYAEKLSGADYIIINSRRLYGTLLHMTDRYPITSRYYQKLFDGSLGYTKVAEFSVYPTLTIGNWKWEINDDLSEESFQVYDHPKALIFQNTKKLNHDTLIHALSPTL